MIDKRRKKFVPVCDVCGNELEPELTFAEARDMMKIANWKSRKLEDGKWIHLCDECIYKESLENPKPKYKDNRKKYIKNS